MKIRRSALKLKDSRPFFLKQDGGGEDKPPYISMTQEDCHRAIFHLDKQQIFALFRLRMKFFLRAIQTLA